MKASGLIHRDLSQSLQFSLCISSAVCHHVRRCCFPLQVIFKMQAHCGWKRLRLLAYNAILNHWWDLLPGTLAVGNSSYIFQLKWASKRERENSITCPYIGWYLFFWHIWSYSVRISLLTTDNWRCFFFFFSLRGKRCLWKEQYHQVSLERWSLLS